LNRVFIAFCSDIDAVRAFQVDPVVTLVFDGISRNFVLFVLGCLALMEADTVVVIRSDGILGYACSRGILRVDAVLVIFNYVIGDVRSGRTAAGTVFHFDTCFGVWADGIFIVEGGATVVPDADPGIA